MNTLIYHNGALGDFLTTLPVISAFRRDDGDTVTLLGKPSHGEFGRQMQLVDEAIDADARTHRFLFTDTAKEREAREFFAPYDAVVIFAAPDSALIGNACRFSRVAPLHQPPFPADASSHIADYHLSLIGALRSPRCRVPVVDVSPEFTRACRSKYGIGSRPYAVLHPGSGSGKKNWPFSRFRGTAWALRRSGLDIVWLSGPAEAALDLPREDCRITDASFFECAALCTSGSVFIGNDSGMTHLAAACGGPVVALFGPSDPAVWAPRGRGAVTIIRHSPQTCAPCHLMPQWNRDCNESCMNRIEPEEVTEAALRIARRSDDKYFLRMQNPPGELSTS